MVAECQLNFKWHIQRHECTEERNMTSLMSTSLTLVRKVEEDNYKTGGTTTLDSWTVLGAEWWHSSTTERSVDSSSAISESAISHDNNSFVSDISNLMNPFSALCPILINQFFEKQLHPTGCRVFTLTLLWYVLYHYATFQKLFVLLLTFAGLKCSKLCVCSRWKPFLLFSYDWVALFRIASTKCDI